MIVVDASAATDMLLGIPERAAFLAEALADGHWVVPEHFTVEVASGLRGVWLGRDIDENEFDGALAALAGLSLDVWPTRPLLPRIRELVHNATTYDAGYVALAEELRIPLVTTDRALATIPDAGCAVVTPG